MRKSIFITAALVLVLALVVGCGEQSAPASPTTSTTSAPATPAESTEAPVPTQAPATATPAASSQTLGDILGNAKWPQTGFSTDATITSADGQSMNMTMAIKGNKMRMETTVEGVKMITYSDSDQKVIYTYDPDQKTAMKMSVAEFESEPGQAPSIEDFTKNADATAKSIGTETIDGLQTEIFEYNTADGNVKAWIAQDLGLPIKVETKTAEGTSTVKYTNIKTDLPDSYFELPAGTTITDMGDLSNLLAEPTPGQ